MVNDFIQPLDLESIFVNHLAGRFRMNNTIAGIMFVLFGVMMSAFMPDMYFLALLLAGMAVFYGIGRIIKY